jgi:iron complex outermembrane receptor protein
VEKGGSVREFRIDLVCAVIAIIAMLPVPVVGQEPDLDEAAEKSVEEAVAEGDGALAEFAQEIIVTAKRREESIYEVPVAISAFEGEELLYQGITDLTDIGKFVPNLNVTGFSAGHTSSANAFIRGIGLQDHLITTDPGVSVYVDGVYLGRQVGQNWSLSNIERVEVLRGPQGTLYGRNSIGGAINIITHAPGAEDISRVHIEAGTRGRWGADFYTNQNLSDHWAISAVGEYTRRDGVGEFLNLPDADVDVGELQDLSARVAVKWSPSDRFSVFLTGDTAKGDGGLRPYTTLIDEVPNGAVYQAGYRNSDVSDDPYDNNTGQLNQTQIGYRAEGVSLTVDWAVTENVNLNLLFSDRHSEYESGLDDDSFFDDFLSFPEDGVADQTSVELQANGAFGKLDFVGGLYYFKESGENDQRPTIFLGGPGTFTLGQEVKSRAIFANVGYRLTDRVRLSGGLRYTEDDKDAYVDINDSLIDTSASDSWGETSGEVAVTYDLQNDMTLYGAIQSGYQSGQFPARPYCLFGAFDPTVPGGVTQPNCFVATDPITALNYEVGLKGRPSPKLGMSVALFYTDYSDLPYQVSTTTGQGFDTRNVIVDQTSWGFEWEGTWYANTSFLLHSSLGYINADVDDPQAVAPLTPDLTLSISPQYSWFLGNGGRVVLRADYSYRGDMYGEPSSDPGRYTQIDARSLINADLSYHSNGGKWSIGLYGRNLTDERYDNARLNTGDYVLVMLSNDASEFGIRYLTRF